ncbi:PQQ-binding-like beta-propeller repeat protein [Xanthomonas translucens]|uniref:outer membrane protein assembly factor BamB family protein n=1 Tax=Xanthomonas campestris pv. translucens TaxID=343 RepID=UPI001F609BFD|nr:PQQ-binding-like beta-propeller repeat protein [Xanthomonas translucens]UNU09929.1 PQQ-binding-like beta-propeller repeat protein [Xanthomonas translucens pv. translucens]
MNRHYAHRTLSVLWLALAPGLMLATAASAQSASTAPAQTPNDSAASASPQGGSDGDNASSRSTAGDGTALGGGAPYATGSSWENAGGGYRNTRFAPAEWQINPFNAARLKTAWTFTTAGDVSATPTVQGSALYVPDWGGQLYRIDTTLGKAVWQVKLSDYTGNAASLSRNSPAIARDSVLVGDQASGTVVAIDKNTGKLLWKTLVEANAQARITASPVVYGDRVYVGVSSGDWGGLSPGYTFSFRGSVAALDLKTGKLLWSFRTAPEGYTGAAVWGTLALDPQRQRVYATTGNNYSVPLDVARCVKNANGDKTAQLACLAPDNYVDSVLALDMRSGKPVWTRRLQGADAWSLSCLVAPTAGVCQEPQGPDYDFSGGGANLFTAIRNGKPQALVGAGQKSGVYWAFDADSGRTVWSTQVGPGGTAGGIEWGSSVDPLKSRVYVAINNNNHTSYTLAPGNTETWNAGSWAALDAASGKILWQVKVPGVDPVQTAFGAGGRGPLASSPGLVYAGSMSGAMTVLDAATGKTLWSFDAGGSVSSAPAVVDGALYWGAGYSRFNFGTGIHKLYKFVPATSRGR